MIESQSMGAWRHKKEVQYAPDDGVVRAFPLHQIYLEDGQFRQTRSGPNWQAGVMTLATCKHHMRTSYGNEADWVGTWLAGFTPKVGCGDNYLLFVARVAESFSSNYALGEYLRANHQEAYRKKRADRSKFGDVYLPRRLLGMRAMYNPSNFYVPQGHVRMELDPKTGRPKWEKDIEYVGIAGRRPAVLLMDRVTLFHGPTFVTTRPLHRSGYKGTIRELKDTTRRVR